MMLNNAAKAARVNFMLDVVEGFVELRRLVG